MRPACSRAPPASAATAVAAAAPAEAQASFDDLIRGITTPPGEA